MSTGTTLRVIFLCILASLVSACGKSPPLVEPSQAFVKNSGQADPEDSRPALIASLSRVTVPLPPNLDDFIADRAAAIRLGKALGNDPDFWLRLQRQYDLAQAMKAANKITVAKLVAV